MTIYTTPRCYYRASSDNPHEYALYSYKPNSEVWRHSASIRNSDLKEFAIYTGNELEPIK
jgi:hypothetical protein